MNTIAIDARTCREIQDAQIAGLHASTGLLITTLAELVDVVLALRERVATLEAAHDAWNFDAKELRY